MCLSAASQLIPAVSGAGLQGRLAKFLSLRHVLLPGTPRVQLRQHLSTSSVSQAMNTHGDRPCLATTPSDNAGPGDGFGDRRDPGAAAQPHFTSSCVSVSNAAALDSPCHYSSSEQGDRLADSRVLFTCSSPSFLTVIHAPFGMSSWPALLDIRHTPTL